MIRSWPLTVILVIILVMSLSGNRALEALALPLLILIVAMMSWNDDEQTRKIQIHQKAVEWFSEHVYVQDQPVGMPHEPDFFEDDV